MLPMCAGPTPSRAVRPGRTARGLEEGHGRRPGPSGPAEWSLAPVVGNQRWVADASPRPCGPALLEQHPAGCRARWAGDRPTRRTPIGRPGCSALAHGLHQTIVAVDEVHPTRVEVCGDKRLASCARTIHPAAGPGGGLVHVKSDKAVEIELVVGSCATPSGRGHRGRTSTWRDVDSHQRPIRQHQPVVGEVLDRSGTVSRCRLDLDAPALGPHRVPGEGQSLAAEVRNDVVDLTKRGHVSESAPQQHLRASLMSGCSGRGRSRCPTRSAQ